MHTYRQKKTRENILKEYKLTKNIQYTPAGCKRQHRDTQIIGENNESLSPSVPPTVQSPTAIQYTPLQTELDEFRKQIMDLRNTIIKKEQERNELLQRDKQLLEEIDRLQTQKLVLRQQLHKHLHTNEVNLNSLRQCYERALVEYRLKLESIAFHKQ
jgi:hypothetical protein